MRVAPLGAWFHRDLDTVVGEATASAAVTHAHPEAVAGAVAVAVAAALAVRGVPGRDLVAATTARVPEGAVAAGLRRAAQLPHGADSHTAAAALGCGERVSAPDTVPYAIWCAAEHLADLPRALWATVAPGGDRDTTCAIAGGIVAAGTGLDAVPAGWLKACEPLPAWVSEAGESEGPAPPRAGPSR